MISGIGNIYADESLWRTRTHYGHPTSSLSTRRARSLLRAVQQVWSVSRILDGSLRVFVVQAAAAAVGVSESSSARAGVR